MRAYLVSSIGVAAAAALLLPLAPTTAADHADRTGRTAPDAPAPAPGAAPQAASAAAAGSGKQANGQPPGSTQSLPLTAPPAGAANGRTLFAASGPAPDGSPDESGVERRKVKPFSLLGVVWDDPEATVDGRIQVRTRAAGSGEWSDWQELETHSGDGPGTAERKNSGTRGASAPLWAGDSDGVEVRVLPPGSREGRDGGHAHTDGDRKGEEDAKNGKQAVKGLPEGMSLELVTPGPDPAPRTGGQPPTMPGMPEEQAPEASGMNTVSRGDEAAERRGEDGGQAPEDTEQADRAVGQPDEESELHGEQRLEQKAELPALSRAATEGEYSSSMRAGEGDHIGPRPGIVTRKGWGADESLREKEFRYTRTVKTAFVHHTATSNGYKCSQAPSIIRSIYRYHVKSSKWRDIGYNFLIDKCGTIYEGRAGGVANPVMGAHTYGFNTNSTGIAVIGSYGSAAPSRDAVEGVAKLTAWKLGLHGVNAKGKSTVTSGGGKYPKGKKVTLHTISGHRDGFNTACPGDKLYGKLGEIRAVAGRLQNR